MTIETGKPSLKDFDWGHILSFATNHALCPTLAQIVLHFPRTLTVCISIADVMPMLICRAQMGTVQNGGETRDSRLDC